MRNYGQFCPLARTLDVVGERWTLLIIRELFARDSRYSDLRHGLPGIATNLLADRLRHLEAHGVIEGYEAPRPIAATVYRLTARGRELYPAVRALAGWGRPLLGVEQDEEEFRGHWAHLGIPVLFDGVDLGDLAPLTAVLRAGDESVTIELTGEGLNVRPDAEVTGRAVVVDGSPAQLTALIRGDTESGARIQGPADGVRRLRAFISRARLGPAT